MSRRDAERSASSRFHFRNSAASSGGPIPLLLTLFLTALLGCAAPPVVPIDPSGPIELAPGQALLIIHIDTDIALEELFLNHKSVARSLGKGKHLWLTRVAEGRYRWERIEIGKQSRNRLKFVLDPDEELGFELKAGKINYPGELVIRSGTLSRWGDGDLIVRNRNHSAMAIRQMRGSYASILDSLPLYYAGVGEDGFLEYYMRRRDGSAVESNRTTSQAGRAETPVEVP